MYWCEMVKPTLLIPGKLVSPDGDAEKTKALAEWVPMDYIMNWIQNRIHKSGIENRVLILKSETASGKSTAFPPVLYEKFVANRGAHAPGIICTQPRVITAIENIRESLQHYPSLRLGQNVGWSTKYDKHRPKTYGLLSATIGTLMMQLRLSSDEAIAGMYKFILIDETHERDLQTDMCIMLLKQMLLRMSGNINCPFVILMSATFDPQPLMRYFGVGYDNHIWCRGETVGFDEMWDWNGGAPVNDYTRAAATLVDSIVRANPNEDPSRSDILIFLPGRGEFKTTVNYLRSLNEKLVRDKIPPFSIIQLESTAVQTHNDDYKRLVAIETKDQLVKIGSKEYTPGRRVIVSTNVAETGLTLANLKYVIDAGYNREMEYNPIYGVRGLLTKPAPKSRVIQRRGRAGRKFKGVFYPLYPRDVFDSLPEIQYPAIVNSDISGVLLDIIRVQIESKFMRKNRGENVEVAFRIEDIDMIDVPSADALAVCLEKLYTLGFISPLSPVYKSNPLELAGVQVKHGVYVSQKPEYHEAYGMTRLGAIASLISTRPESLRMIFAGFAHGANIMDLVTIAAWLAIDYDAFVEYEDEDIASLSTSSSDFADEESSRPKKKSRPAINWVGVYQQGLPLLVTARDTASALYKIRLLIADEFIDGLILYNAALRIVASSTQGRALSDLATWCRANVVSYRAILEFIKTRDELIDQLLTHEFNVFSGDQSLVETSPDNIMNKITLIKHCIYEGFRLNTISKIAGKYRTPNGLEVVTPKLFRDDEMSRAATSEFGFAVTVQPTTVLYHDLVLKTLPNGNTVVQPLRISTMDGFVNVDPDFAI